MIYTHNIQKAIQFSIHTHEIHQKQKRKGKDIPYITHPLTVGIILARAGASEEVIIAGILHDTIEDSTPENKVTKEILAKEFSPRVAELVMYVTESNKSLSWAERKAEALEHISHFDHDALLVKSADIISNMSELLDDHSREGDSTWARFHVPKEAMLEHAFQAMSAITAKWPESPLARDLIRIKDALTAIAKSE